MINRLLGVPLLLAVATPSYSTVIDHYTPGGSHQTECYRTEYREEYVPGTRQQPGYVRRYTDRVVVPCYRPYASPPSIYEEPPHTTDDNSCIEGSLLGGLAGGAIGGAAATQENWIWSIPSGIIGGALIGCQIDGG